MFLQNNCGLTRNDCIVTRLMFASFSGDSKCVVCVVIWTHFTKTFSIRIQIWRKIHFTVIPFLATILLHIFAHVTTAQLSWHVQEFEAISSLEFGYTKMKFHHIWIVMEKLLAKWAQADPDKWEYWEDISGGVIQIWVLLCWARLLVTDKVW